MNYLSLVRRAMLEASISGNGPTTLAGAQTKDVQRFINWVADAWTELQGERDDWTWAWQRVAINIDTGANTPLTLNTVPASRWVKDSVYRGTMVMDYWQWEDFKQVYPTTGAHTTGDPVAWTIRPDLAFVINTYPTVPVVMFGENYANPTALAFDTDTPTMPADLHLYLVWQAVSRYAARDEAGSLYATSQKFAADLKRQIWDRCAPEITLGGALA